MTLKWMALQILVIAAVLPLTWLALDALFGRAHPSLHYFTVFVAGGAGAAMAFLVAMDRLAR